MAAQLLEVKNLSVEFKAGSITTKAINNVDFEVKENECLGVVGESGSGKSVTASSILKLIPSPPGDITSGQVLFKNKDLLKMSKQELRKIRGNDISMIFQEPSSSLNPVLKIGDQITEGIRTHQNITKKEAKIKAINILELVGIPAPEKRVNMYPHEFSGGMLQRVMIAIALSCDPSLLIADEPTTALDVTIQNQILKILKELQDELNMSIILITHDLGVVWEACDKVLVMYAGKSVEYTDAKQLYENPLHPYTWGLLESQLTSSQEHGEQLATIPGAPP